ASRRAVFRNRPVESTPAFPLLRRETQSRPMAGVYPIPAASGFHAKAMQAPCQIRATDSAQHVFEEGPRARIARTADSVHRLPPDTLFSVLAGGGDQQIHSLRFAGSCDSLDGAFAH